MRLQLLKVFLKNLSLPWSMVMVQLEFRTESYRGDAGLQLSTSHLPYTRKITSCTKNLYVYFHFLKM